ncbi:interleukin-21 isoform X2 [Ictalurus furcatus]|uniref:interleukin-21 isoform X2 n=1 Tax=Ictalurus furcatus TaxID=66913 RepID=UPI00235095E6|nr:interleukin-21 isoform X2 [Ictalurus furcatus]
MFLHSPTNDIKECCSRSALECFKSELKSTNHKNPMVRKLVRNLGKPTIMNSVNTCTEDEIKKTKCMSCDSYPRVSSKQFLSTLQSRLQMAYSRL